MSTSVYSNGTLRKYFDETKKNDCLIAQRILVKWKGFFQICLDHNVLAKVYISLKEYLLFSQAPLNVRQAQFLRRPHQPIGPV